MKLPRREFLRLAAGVAATATLPCIARAEIYPSRLVRLIVTFAPGGALDIVARLMGQWLTERLGQQFIIDNRPGAGGLVGTEAVVNASPDGYTLLMLSSANTMGATLYGKSNFDIARDIVPIGGIVRVPNVMEVTPSIPAETVPEFIAYARSNPGKVNMASGGLGTTGHMNGELFKMMTGINMLHVPYRGGGPALTDLIGGQVQLLFDPMPSSIEYVKSGKIRALAVTSAIRSEALPELPTVGDFVPGFKSTFWVGVGGPKDTPAEIIGSLNREINAVLANPKFTARLADLGGAALPGSPAEFGKLVANETEKWAKVVKFSSAKPD